MDSLLNLAVREYARSLHAARLTLAPRLPVEVLARILARLAHAGMLSNATLRQFLSDRAFAVLVLAGCVRLTDELIRELPTFCTTLRILNRKPHSRK